MIGAVRPDCHRWALILAVMLVLTSAVVPAQDLVVVRQPAAAVDPAAAEPAGRCADGSKIIRLSADGAERLMSQGFFAACDPAVSFNGEQILFAGKRSADDRLQVWRMAASGTLDLGKTQSKVFALDDINNAVVEAAALKGPSYCVVSP